MYTNTSELYHYGVLGMKWGVRRNKSEVRSSTPSKKKLSDEELTSAIKRLNLERTYEKMSKPPSKVEQTKKLVDATSAAANQAKHINRESMAKSKTKEQMDLSKMTDQQLRDRINRSNLEKQYNDMFANDKAQISKGKQQLSKVLEIGGSTLAIGSSALGIALALKELKS